MAGRWTVERSLLDVRTGACGSFRGTADFRPVQPTAPAGPADPDPAAPAGPTAPFGTGAVLLHAEEGELTWGATVTRASRTLRLCPRPDGTADVTFADGRPFHDLDLRTGHWTTRHPCAQDLYGGTFTVRSADEWHLRWQVNGPAKTQLLRSVYRRVHRPAD
ncbi:hypothetical protein KGS77_05615 [Streptomyces sp. MST-110588]|nr:hypothetical protein KGS77_05615 [Streptomyces sp. MST-110588]